VGNVVLNAGSFYAPGKVYRLVVTAEKNYNRTGTDEILIEVLNMTAPIPEVSIQ
jgi:hypothetical protein